MTDHPDPSTASEGLEVAAASSRLNPFNLFLRHKWIITLAMATSVAIGALYYARATPIYQSSAKVLVVKKAPDTLPLPGTSTSTVQSEDYLSTHQTLISSPLIVGEAVRKRELGKLRSFAGIGNPTDKIILSLKVTREMNAGSPTNILKIAFRGEGAEDSAVVVNAVIESYQHFLQMKYQNVSNETAKLIANANDVLANKLTAKQKEYLRFSAEHPDLLRSKDGTSATQERLMGLEAKRSALLLLEAETRGRIKAFEKATKEGHYTRTELLSLLNQLPARQGNEAVSSTAVFEERLMALELKEKTLLEDYDIGHPEVRSVRGQIAQLRSLMERLGKLSGAQDADPVKTHLQGLKLELENTQMATQALQKLIESEQKEAKATRLIEKQDEDYRLEIARNQVLFDAIAKRLDEVSIVKNFAGGFEAETISPPGIGSKVYPSLILVLVASLFLGLVGGFGLAYLAEYADQSFRTPEEIRRRLGLAVIGHIPYFEPREDEIAATPDGVPVNPSLRTLSHPKSRESEAYRGVRTAVLFSSRDGQHKVIQVTSPDMGDGKSTLTANLAVSVAQSGKRILLVDADFRRPRVHKIFNLSAEKGLASVITGDAELMDVVQPTTIPNLFALPCGPIPDNPAELLTQPRFQELLEYLRDQYDFVLVDTPPLLAVTDPCVVVPCVDGVILTVRISKNARPHASRAKEMLTTLKATVLGVVVNGVGADAKGYGYDGYRYGYSYTYSNYEQSESYHSDEEKDANKNKDKRKGFLSWMRG